MTALEHTVTRDAVETATWRASGLVTQVTVLAVRALRPVFLDPARVFFSLLQPLVMLLLFSQVFRSVADTPLFPKGVSYIDYLVPAILFMTATTVASESAVSMTNDLRNGVLARFRSMPVRPVSVLIARSVADLMRGAMELALVLILATLVFGYSPSGGLVGMLGALLLALTTGWSLGWVFLATATWLRATENVQALSVLVVIVLQFASSAFVPVAALPEYIQAVAHVNPLSYGITAARNLSLGNAPDTALYVTLLICGLISLVGAFTAVRGFKRG
ncbi:ABC-2 type transport system permease protein [Saccharothrix ecbatanensis]|uniref:Transport permease protein n=1 Tax=Saccharothrix ecbatanensis TaxID=1105145 RepID=A0A7W9HK79_9PSEU|nr:ABC transporter permease [Saccharothrix ecbatanensis]MBB5803630.1 ABC-2 type transport system permease protein [Saccharothrix ecbatanensis]